MDGARLIVNARYFHVAQPGEIASKYALVPEAAAALVNYIATRESVVLNFSPEYEIRPATQKQKDAIERFLEASPDIEKSREYKAYIENRTAANASRLITRATEYVFGLNEDGETKNSSPATRAQRERIREFVEKVPAIRQTPEYMDYMANKTRENASEVLSHALEVALDSAADPETLRIMLNYIAERPGVVKDGEKQHGLFCSEGTADLEAEKDAIAEHKGNIYSMVFSLRRADADTLGYDGQEMWRDLFVKKQAELAKELHVSLSELHWIAAVHNTKHHPHAHFMAYSINEKTRMYLSKGALEEIKSDFVSEIFRDERYSVFAPRDEIRRQLSDQLEQLLMRLDQNSAVELAELQVPEKLAALKTAILSSKGRHVYKFLPQDVKATVDRLLDDLSTVPEMKELLTEYGKYQQQLESYYKLHPDEPRPLSEVTMRSNLYPLKNLVVRYALQTETPGTKQSMVETGNISGFSAFESFAENEKNPDNIEIFRTPAEFAEDTVRPAEPPQEIAAIELENRYAGRRIEPIPERSFQKNVEYAKEERKPPYDGNAEEKFRYAQYLRYEANEPEAAVLWYNLAEQLGHAEAAYQLAQHYLRHPADRDVPLANEYLLTAKLRFEEQLQESRNIYLVRDIQEGMSYADAVKENGLCNEADNKAQRILSRAAYYLGRIHLAGIEIESMEGIEPEDLPRLQVPVDPHKAAAYLELAHNSGYAHAAYYLGKIYFRGELSADGAPDYDGAIRWYTAGMNASEYCRFALAGMVERGEGFTSDASTAASLYRGCLGNNSYLVSESAYAIAQMQRGGSLPETDMQALYKQAADIWLKQENPEAHIRLRLAGMYEHGLGVETDLAEALRQCQEAEKTDPSPRLSYRIAQLMEKNGMPQDAVYGKYAEALDGMLREEADPETEPDSQRIYRIASMYRYGRGTEVDPVKALEWYLKDSENPYSRFGAAGIKRYGGDGVKQDISGAEALYRSCLDCEGYLAAESAYALAQMQRNGSLPETDMQTLYKKAADVWLKQKQPEEYVRLRLARMYEHGLGVAENLPAAIQFYESVTQTPEIHYRLGGLMRKTGYDPVLIHAQYVQALNGMLREEQDAKNKPDAQRAVYLASMYRYGLGANRDMDEAIRWYWIAAERGSQYAEEQLQEIEDRRRQAQSQRNMGVASRLLGLIANALRQQILRDQQPGARPDRKQRRQQRRLKHALGQKEDFEQVIK